MVNGQVWARGLPIPMKWMGAAFKGPSGLAGALADETEWCVISSPWTLPVSRCSIRSEGR